MKKENNMVNKKQYYFINSSNYCTEKGQSLIVDEIAGMYKYCMGIQNASVCLSQ